MRGRVKWFNNEKGYGFIEYKDNEDIFVHYSAISQEGYKSLSEGQYVEFNLIETPKGYQALDVVVVKEVTALQKIKLQFLGKIYSCFLFLFD